LSPRPNHIPRPSRGGTWPPPGDDRCEPSTTLPLPGR